MPVLHYVFLYNYLEILTYLSTYYFLGKEPPEVTFTGSEFLTYDLVQLGGEPILSTRDEISMYFRTNRDDGLLFYTGKSPRNAKKKSYWLSVKDTDSNTGSIYCILFVRVHKIHTCYKMCIRVNQRVYTYTIFGCWNCALFML